MQQIEIFPLPGSDARMVGYLHRTLVEMEDHRTKRPCVLIFPGGGYEMLSQREADPVAFHFFEKGYQVFILFYSLKEKSKDMQVLMEGSAAIMALRDHSEEWNIMEDQIAVCGFSAGGHAAASVGILWNHPSLLEKMDTHNGKNRPNAMILSYPVITAGKFAHQGSLQWISGAPEGTEQNEFWALDRHVDSTTPPTFVWHTVEDDCVPIENTLLLINALQKNHISYECHLYPHGGHGMSVCTVEVGTPNARARSWVNLCDDWLEELFSFPE